MSRLPQQAQLLPTHTIPSNRHRGGLFLTHLSEIEPLLGRVDVAVVL